MTIGLTKRAVIRPSVALAISFLATVQVCGQTTWRQGDTWLKWKHEAREAYVFGYIVGYSTGHWNGCKQRPRDLTGKDESRGNDAVSACQSQQSDFSKGTDSFVESITDFYNRYPEDRDISIQEIIEQLGNGLSVEQLHEYPFMRHHTTLKRE